MRDGGRQKGEYIDVTKKGDTPKAMTAGPTGQTGENLIVWVVDDNAGFAKNLAEVINLSDGLTCAQTFGTCEEVIAGLESDPPPDVVLLDIGLPGMSGIEGIRRIKALAPSVHAIMLTVFEDNDTIFRAISAGASGYLHKSAPLDELISALRSILVGGVPMNPHIARKILDMFTDLSSAKTDYGLTAREKEVLQLLIDGHQKKAIASKMFVSFHTIDTHLRNIYAKLEVNSRSGAIAKALKEHLM
jgi:DNA-binding NarL/FixJ family response regulator